MVLNTEWAQVEVIDLINDGSGLAFGIIGGRSTGVVVKSILPGGVADRDGRLQSGDHILQIGEVNLRGLGSEQVASVLRQCGIHVRMVVARPVESTNADYQALGSNAPIVPTKILGDPVELDRHLLENGYTETFNHHYHHHSTTTYSTSYILPQTQSDIQIHPISGAIDVVKDPLPIGKVPQITSQTNNNQFINNMLPLDMALQKPNLPETEIYSVELKKDDLGLGITVAGYVCEKEEISGIFVKSISKGSAADLTNKIKINDRIVMVDGISVVGHTNHQAVEILKNTGPIVNIKFERYLRGPKYEQLQQAIRANELNKPSTPPSPSTLISLPKIPFSQIQTSFLGIEPEGESRTSFDFDSTILIGEDQEIVIDCGKSIQFSIDSRESIYDKWREKLDVNVDIVIAEIAKDPSSGLGISLEGTVDVEDGKEVRPHHYIRNILPDGPVGRNGVLQAGDELLEVNGIQLLGLNHLEVVTILKQLPNFVSLVCARYPVPIRIIDTSQHREAFQARKILAGSLQTLIPTEKLVKAKSETSLASSFASEICINGDGGSKSRSLEMIAGLPMWSDQITIVELNKGDYGLGFSILDYQDPLNPEETVIVIRSLVPGGVAQLDGRLIPGDRLLSVNDINVEHATLDTAVQVLKGAPKGIVRISVAKPLTTDNLSQFLRKILQEWSEELDYLNLDTEDDQTCLEDFQECLEEYQECLEVVQICIDDDDNSFNHSSNISQVDDDYFDQKISNGTTSNFLETPEKKIKLATDSDLDLSYKSTNNDQTQPPPPPPLLKQQKTQLNNNNQCDKIIKNDSSTITYSSNLDGYETCIDESLSDEGPKILSSPIEEEITPTNSKHNSVPCLTTSYKGQFICLDSKLDDELKSYDSLGTDEFFLVQYPTESLEMSKYNSEPNVLENFNIPITKKITYRVQEYYNDYEDCLESYKIYGNERFLVKDEEMSDDLIFNEIFLPFKSRSAPDIMDTTFVKLTYDPGPDKIRRKSLFVTGHESESDAPTSSMTVIRPIETLAATNFECQFDDMLQKHWGAIHRVKVYRQPNTSLGISIVGGKVDLSPNEQSSNKVLGIFVKNVVPDSPAGRTGQFKTGDRILEVSGVDLRQANHETAVQAIRNAPNPVTFVIQSIAWSCENDSERLEENYHSPDPPPATVKHQTKSQLDTSNKVSGRKNESNESVPVVNDQSNAAAPVTPTTTATTTTTTTSISTTTNTTTTTTTETTNRIISPEESDEDDDEEDVRELEGRITTAKGQQIDRASAGNVKRNKEEIAADPEQEDDFGYTMNKVKKKYANLGHSILMVQLERSSQGLGLSLAGHKDRNCMAVFVCGLNPNGAAFKTGGIQIGDEILEVNGVVLHGRCHLNASAIIKGLSGPIFKVIILRRKTAIDDIAVKPITQFPVSLAEEASEEHFSANYPNVRTVAIKKGTQSLGIMIIEGKHAEVGQGIFISDIQEGSAAEKAGLEIGEMILAVNKDSLVGSNYDTAASLLKRTEGLVTLVVSNPGKKDQKQDQSAGADATTNKTGLKPSATPSRPATPVPEPPADPATCPITPGKDVTIEILTENKGLGIFFVGGKDTLMPTGIVVVEVYAGGVAEKDGRLQAGDQILDVNGTSLKDVTNTTASQALRQTLPKMKLIIYRPETIEYNKIDVELIKKPGKGLGLSVIAKKSGKGVYIADILSGGTADVDGHIMRGDLLISVNGQSVENATGEEAGAILKTVTGKVTLKLHRYKPTR